YFIVIITENVCQRRNYILLYRIVDIVVDEVAVYLPHDELGGFRLGKDDIQQVIQLLAAIGAGSAGYLLLAVKSRKLFIGKIVLGAVKVAGNGIRVYAVAGEHAGGGPYILFGIMGVRSFPNGKQLVQLAGIVFV